MAVSDGQRLYHEYDKFCGACPLKFKWNINHASLRIHHGTKEGPQYVQMFIQALTDYVQAEKLVNGAFLSRLGRCVPKMGPVMLDTSHPAS